MKKLILFSTALLLTVVFSKNVFAGPPFNNLEGVGGVAFNPLAYLANSDDGLVKVGEQNIAGKPRIGAWYV
ncbi:MAG: hypothetical protein WC417_07830, partial [Candidatus Omnitrophota bacterium]